jgi:uncharacterized protein (TIGR02246 family)
MKSWKWCVLALGLVAVLAAGRFVTAGRAPGDVGEPKARADEPKAKADEKKAEEAPTGKGKRAQEFIAAFDKGDAKAVAAFWTEDATYTDLDGHEHKGRPAIQKLYEKVFADGKGATLKIYPSSVKQLSPDVGLEEGITEVTPADGGPRSAAHFSAVLVKKDGEWYLQSVTDSVAQPPSNAAHFEDIDWLLGSWTSEADKGTGEALTASYSWAENRNFIVSSFATTLKGLPVTGGTQWIGWDAVDKQIRSWTFYSGGGFGDAVWTKDGDKWAVETTARTADGKRVTATNVITKVDADHATWQMTKLTVNGERQTDPKPMKMARVKPEKS